MTRLCMCIYIRLSARYSGFITREESLWLEAVFLLTHCAHDNNRVGGPCVILHRLLSVSHTQHTTSTPTQQTHNTTSTATQHNVNCHATDTQHNVNCHATHTQHNVNSHATHTQHNVNSHATEAEQLSSCTYHTSGSLHVWPIGRHYM